MKGTIVRIRKEGYGFIKPLDGEKDVFFHVSSLVDITFDELTEGDVVTFEVEEGPKGPSATNVQRVATASEAPNADADTEMSAPVEDAPVE